MTPHRSSISRVLLKAKLNSSQGMHLLSSSLLLPSSLVARRYNFHFFQDPDDAVSERSGGMKSILYSFLKMTDHRSNQNRV